MVFDLLLFYYNRPNTNSRLREFSNWSCATSFFVMNQYFLFAHDFTRKYRFDNTEDLLKYPIACFSKDIL